jgi:hypothetical protein
MFYQSWAENLPVLNKTYKVFKVVNLIKNQSWDSTISIKMLYRLSGPSSIPGRGKRFFSSQQHLEPT